jgi:hypothetical protein
MTKEERELAEAIAELAAAKEELARIERGEPAKRGRPRGSTKTKPAKPAKSKRRPIHHPESDLRSAREGYGHRAGGGTRMRMDMTPVVTMHLDPTDRPVYDRMPRKVSVRVYDDGGFQQGLAMTMMEREADVLAASLPFGWRLVERYCA